MGCMIEPLFEGEQLYLDPTFPNGYPYVLRGFQWYSVQRSPGEDTYYATVNLMARAENMIAVRPGQIVPWRGL